MSKLNTANLGSLSPAVKKPEYHRDKVTPGMVHVGVGNFHRAHQCVFLEEALHHPGQEKWGYIGIGLMPGDAKMQDVLKEQDFMYTLWEKSVDKANVRVIGCHQDFILAPSDPEAAIKVLSAETTKIVTLTVTEKGYFVDLSTGALDVGSPMVKSDIECLKAPQSTTPALKTVAGFLIAAARRRIAANTPGFTVLSCDNIQENGCKARAGIMEMAKMVDPEIHAWFEKNVTFPNSMVDRITPVTTDAHREALEKEHGIIDAWPVVAEDFLLWVIEDKFPYGRPAWENCVTGKCMFVEDVVPYEFMKLRLLNSVHAALAYPAMLVGHELVHDAMNDPRVMGYIQGYMAAAGRTVPPVKGIEQAQWKKDVQNRFKNPAICDTIVRLTEDATNRLSVAVAPMLKADAAMGKGLGEADLKRIVLPIACWMQCVMGVAGAQGNLKS